MKILCSGAHGFIGQHLTQELEAQGNIVYKLDRDLISNINGLTEFVEEIQPEMIFHLASYGNHYDQTDLDQTFVTNVVETYFLLKACEDIPYKAFINFSSSIIQQNIDTFYSVTKECGEALSRGFAYFRRPVVTVRPASVFGEGERDDRFIPTLCRSLKNGDRMPLDGPPRHSWIYVGDLIDAVLKIAQKADKLKGQTINISYGQEWSNTEIAHKLEDISGHKLQMKKVSGIRSYDSRSWLVYNEDLRDLNWTPKFNLTKGLELTYKYYTK